VYSAWPATWIGASWRDDRELGAGGPGLEVVILVDERPDLLDASLHLAGAADEACHHAGPAARRIARSIFG
jgi:hypothetical protein